MLTNTYEYEKMMTSPRSLKHSNSKPKIIIRPNQKGTERVLENIIKERVDRDALSLVLYILG